MDAKQLFEAGKVTETITALNDQLKSNPLNPSLRTFLFEMLCFNGDLERAEKQLDVIGQQDALREPIVQIYRNLLHCEMERDKVFSGEDKPNFLVDPPTYLEPHVEAIGNNDPESVRKLFMQAQEEYTALAGSADGEPFSDFADCNDLQAVFLEFYMGKDYCWIPFEQISAMEFTKPEHPRDLLWTACELVLWGEAETVLRGHVPALYHGSSISEDEQVQLGRATDWQGGEGEPVVGVGHRIFLLGEDIRPMAKIRRVEFSRN
jgi:type VI secretion system protein ImpE